jgi:recombination protein RecA
VPPKKSKEPKEPVGPVTSLFNQGEDARMKVLESTVQDLEKRFGEGTIVRLGDAAHLQVEVIPSGSLTVDIALGVGGIPRGRVTEIYGPESSGKTTLCLHVIAEAQKRGGLCAFVDMEHALDPRYASLIGVDVDRLYVSQPDTAEQALEITESLVRSGALDVVVLDSVAALVPRVEIEGEMGDSHVGIQARLMSQALRKLSGAIKQSNVAVLFTNQLRDKIGVMYGCFSEDSRVLLADGTRRPIGEIVNNKQAVDVMSYNIETGEFEAKPVIEWFKQGKPVEKFAMTDAEIGLLQDEYLTFVTHYPDARGKRTLTCTPNHQISTPNGFQAAEDLDLGDYIIGRFEELCPSPDLEQVIFGSLLGNGALRKDSARRLRYFSTQDRRAEYLCWKAEAFGGMAKGVYENAVKGMIGFESTPAPVFDDYKAMFYGEDGRKSIAPDAVYRLTPLALAVWYQDSGRCCEGKGNELRTAALTPLETSALQEAFARAFGLYPQFKTKGRWTHIVFSADQSDAFERLVAPYIHPSNADMLRTNSSLAGLALPDLKFDHTHQVAAVPGRIVEIRRKLLRGKKAVRYNLQVAGNANYLVNDLIVHNSPETTSGGRALKFYASLRLDVRKQESIKASGGEVIGSRTRIRVTKNKVAPPFREAEFDIMFLEGGISKNGEVLDLGTELGIIDKRGAFYRYNDGLLGQGRENAKAYLGENPAVRDEIEDAIRAHYGLPPVVGSVPAAPPPVQQSMLSANGGIEDDDGYTPDPNR